MHFSTTHLLAFLPLAASSLLPSQPQHIFANPTCKKAISNLSIPTAHDSAILARRILHLTPLGTLSTVFPTPKDNASPLEQRPSNLGGVPIGLMDYIADCESSGNPTILAINIATSFKNAAAGSNVSLALQWTPPNPPTSRIGSFLSPSTSSTEPVPYSAANLPRFSLLGYLEKIPASEVASLDLTTCFTSIHKDAKYWLPGNRIHSAEWVRLVVQDIYWVGGFGDRAYIGWIDAEVFRNVTKEEWEEVRLPGEKKGWREWAVEVMNWEL